METKLIIAPKQIDNFFSDIEPNAAEMVTAMARISTNKQGKRRIANAENFCIDRFLEGHHSVFEMLSYVFYVETCRDIEEQAVRHSSHRFQIFSQRYVDGKKVLIEIEYPKPRPAALANKPSASANLAANQGSAARDEANKWYNSDNCSKAKEIMEETVDYIKKQFKNLLDLGTSTETARRILPLSTKTKYYVHARLRDLIFYFNQRLHPHAQQEHRELAFSMAKDLISYDPSIGRFTYNFNNFRGGFSKIEFDRAEEVRSSSFNIPVHFDKILYDESRGK